MKGITKRNKQCVLKLYNYSCMVNSIAGSNETHDVDIVVHCASASFFVQLQAGFVEGLANPWSDTLTCYVLADSCKQFASACNVCRNL